MHKSISVKAPGTASDKKSVYYIALNLWQSYWSGASTASCLLYERNVHIKRLLLWKTKSFPLSNMKREYLANL